MKRQKTTSPAAVEAAATTPAGPHGASCARRGRPAPSTRSHHPAPTTHGRLNPTPHSLQRCDRRSPRRSRHRSRRQRCRAPRRLSPPPPSQGQQRRPLRSPPSPSAPWTSPRSPRCAISLRRRSKKLSRYGRRLHRLGSRCAASLSAAAARLAHQHHHHTAATTDHACRRERHLLLNRYHTLHLTSGDWYSRQHG